VPNPSFEMLIKLPNEHNRGIHNTKYWRTPTFSSPDYYHADGDKITGTPKNDFGNQVPHSGKAYAGICLTKDYIEYIAVHLTDTLKQGEEYLIELYISRADKSLTSVDEFGVLFTDKIKWSLDLKGIAQKPSVDFISNGKYRDKDDWTKLSGSYVAEGFETTIILGHFIYDNPERFRGFCHYYIDDVSVSLVTKESDANSEPIVKDSLIVTNTKEDVSQPLSPEIGKRIPLKNIFYATNESELLPESFTELDKLADYLNDNPNTAIEISGHTDNSGSEVQNKKLSEARAKAISEYLASKGINKSRMRHMGYGSTKPLTTNSTEEGRQLNRRVEFLINKI
jgi:OOP family OmpA-OmpF porin